jgi:hypothetical protein
MTMTRAEREGEGTEEEKHANKRGPKEERKKTKTTTRREKRGAVFMPWAAE